MLSDAGASAAQAARLAELRRAFKRMLPRRLTVAEKAVLARAVHLTLRAEAAALDPNTCANDVVRLDGAANRARLAWARLAAVQRTAPRTSAPSLSELIANTRAREQAA
jgi:hypothetical protein